MTESVAQSTKKSGKGLRDERHVIFDGGRRLMWCTTFETDWDPYVEDAALIIGIENFIDWIQHTKEWPRFEAWLRTAGGVEAVNAGLIRLSELMGLADGGDADRGGLS